MNSLDILRDMIKGKPLLFLIVFFTIGCLLGWWVMGYVIWPTQYVGESRTYDLSVPEKEQYISMVADSYKLTGNAGEARASLAGWDSDEVAGLIATTSSNLRNKGRSEAAQRVEDLALALGTTTGTAPAASAPAPADVISTQTPQPVMSGFSIVSLIRICIGLIVIIIVIAAILFVVDLRKRKAKVPGVPFVHDETPADEAKADEGNLGPFTSTFTLGDDDYDESFSIESSTGEFLGECGIGVSEIIESGPPDRVTAFEVWLFDKSDIRTVTKVLMSDYAFNEPGLRDKLAPKGEAILAQPAQTFDVETDALNMEARVVEVTYGNEGQYPNSYFDSLTIELTVRPREGAAEEVL